MFPFPCVRGCGANFRTAGTMKKHCTESCTIQLKCSDCGKDFRLTSELKRHVKACVGTKEVEVGVGEVQGGIGGDEQMGGEVQEGRGGEMQGGGVKEVQGGVGGDDQMGGEVQEGRGGEVQGGGVREVQGGIGGGEQMGGEVQGLAAILSSSQMASPFIAIKRCALTRLNVNTCRCFNCSRH